MSETLDSKIKFQDLCNLFEKISKAKGAQKIDELRKFTRQCRILANKIRAKYPDMDISLFPIFRLLLPALERDRGPYGLKSKTLISLYIRVFCLGKNSDNAAKLTSYKKPMSTGPGKSDDLAERVYWLMRNRLPDSGCLSLHNVNEFLDNLANCHETNRSKDDYFLHVTRKISASELKWLTRLLLKDLKLGLAQKKAFEVIHPDAEALFNVSSNLRRVCERFAAHNPSEAVDGTSGSGVGNGIEIFSHVKPMLLERFKIEQIGSLFVNGQQYYVQTKFDGERSQIHVKEGRFKYFTRQGFDITQNASYGETTESGGFLTSNIAGLLSTECRSAILDGEMMGWHKERRSFGTKALNYDVKKLTERSRHQPCFVAYDMLLYNEESLLDRPYAERLDCLRRAVKEKEGVLMLCQTKTVGKSEQLVEIFNVALNNDDEGIVVKRPDGPYRPNVRERSGCYKIKAEYSDGLVQDLDLLILGGYYGQGRCSGTVRSFLVGVASPPTNKSGTPSEHFAVVSVSSGLSDSELGSIQKRLKPHWRDKKPIGVIGPRSEPPDVWISPKHSLVLQLRATEITRSKSYPIGYTLRFPRVLKVRLDKPWYDACSTTEYLSLVKNRNPVQKLTKRNVRASDIDAVAKDEDDEDYEPAAPKTRKTRSDGGSSVSSVYSSFMPAIKDFDDEPQRASRLFEDKEFCVINGDAELSRDDAVRLLQEHSAKVAQNAGRETFCVLVGDPETLKAQTAISTGKYDVASLAWLRRATLAENLARIADFLPWELFSASTATRRRIEDTYDRYWDSYADELDEAGYERATRRIEETAERDRELPLTEMKKLDRLLFDAETSPYSVFRGVVGYFRERDDVERHSFAFMSGTLAEELSDSVDYVFANEGEVDQEEREESGRSKIPVVSSKWIGDCFAGHRLLAVDDYLV